MFRRIVVPLDGTCFSEAALAPARELARAFNARLEIVRALSPDDIPSAAFADDEMIALGRIDDADTYLRRIVDLLREQGYKADMSLRHSLPDVGIAAIAELDHADVIVMTTHLRWKVDPSGGPSTTLQLFGRTRTPILVWRVAGALEEDGGPDVDERPPRLARTESPIMVPLDGSTFAERALGPAETLAKTFGLYLLLAHAVEPGATLEDEIAAERRAEAYLHRVRGQVEARGGHAAVSVPTRDTVQRDRSALARIRRRADRDRQPRAQRAARHLPRQCRRAHHGGDRGAGPGDSADRRGVLPTHTTEPPIWQHEIVDRG